MAIAEAFITMSMRETDCLNTIQAVADRMERVVHVAQLETNSARVPALHAGEPHIRPSKPPGLRSADRGGDRAS